MDAFVVAVVTLVVTGIGAIGAYTGPIRRHRTKETPTVNPPTSPLPIAPQPDQRMTHLSRGQGMLPGESLYSPDGRTRFTLQPDANMVVTVERVGDICDTGTTNRGQPTRLYLGDDGWLVLYGVNGEELWKQGPHAVRLEVQDNSHVVLYPAAGPDVDAVWATDTFFKAGKLVHWIPPEQRVRW